MSDATTPARFTVAGGVVTDGAGRALLLERDVERDGQTVHEVRLPKGKPEPGEDLETAARREVGEESGYWQLETLADLGEAVSRFHFYGRANVRTERYFLFRTDPATERRPSPDAGSEEALFEPMWTMPEDAAALLTYESEREFMRRAEQYL